MKINPISFQHNFIKPQKKNSNVVSNPILMQTKNDNIAKYPISFGSLIQNSDLLKAGYSVASIENNKLSNDSDKILINSADKFLAFVNSPNAWSKKIVLTNDIDLSGKEIKPIGSVQKPFKGEFDGNGCKITNFKIDSPNGRNIGLFGKCENAKISNLEIEKAFIRGKEQIGGFAGDASNSELNNCHFQGYINGNKIIGGLIGRGNKNTITSSSSKCDILSEKENTYNPFSFENESNESESIGGFIGSDYESIIDSSYSKSTIKGAEQTGGFIGYAKNSIIKNSVFDGTIIGDSKTGSMIGWGENSSINTSYSLSNQEKYIGYDINNSTSRVYDSIVNLMSNYNYWDSDIWTKEYGKLPRLKIQVERMQPKQLFLEDVNNDIKVGNINKISSNFNNKVQEEIELNLLPPKHYDENNELLERINDSTDSTELRQIFGRLAVSLKDNNLLGKNSTDKYDELFVALMHNKNMDINSTYEHYREDLNGMSWNVWCNPLFILTCMNKAYALKEALKRDDADFTVGSGSGHNETILNQAFQHHIDECAYVMLTEPKMQDYIDKHINELKSLDLSAFAKLLLMCYPDEIPEYNEKRGSIEFSKEFEVPDEYFETIQEVQKLEDIQRKCSIDVDYRDSLGNNILNIASTLEDQEEALRVLIAAKETGTDVDNWNNKSESPIGHGIYTNKPHFVTQILDCTTSPFIRIGDGTDAMLMFSNMPEENYSVNYMDIARKKGLSINTNDELGNTPLINAINLGHHEAIKYLLQNGANPNKCNKDNQTPLHHACINSDIDSIEMLLNAYAYPNVKDVSGMRPFDYLDEDLKEALAEKFNDQEILYQESSITSSYVPSMTDCNVDYFKEIYSIDEISQKVLDGENADEDILQITKNLHLNNSIADLTDWNNNTILHIAAQSTSPYAKECLKAALEKGMDINALNDDKETPLISAINAYICAGTTEKQIALMQNIKLLLDCEPNVDLVDNNKQSALHKICQSGNLILFNEILKLNPKINQVDINGNTPFQYIPTNANVPMYITAREYLKKNNIIKG